MRPEGRYSFQQYVGKFLISFTQISFTAGKTLSALFSGNHSHDEKKLSLYFYSLFLKWK